MNLVSKIDAKSKQYVTHDEYSHVKCINLTARLRRKNNLPKTFEGFCPISLVVVDVKKEAITCVSLALH